MFNVIWSNCDLIVMGPQLKMNELKSILGYKEKNMVMKKFKLQTQFTRVDIFEEITAQEVASNEYLQSKYLETVVANNFSPVSCIITYQGMIDRVIEFIKNNGSLIGGSIKDCREKFPKPMLDRMYGFRGNQEELTKQFLLKDRSGGFKAPTRYGKTTVITNICRAYPRINGVPQIPIIITTPGNDLLPQLIESLKSKLDGREIKSIYSGETFKGISNDITVVSPDSMHKVPKDNKCIVIADETHAFGSELRSMGLNEFKNARFYTIGATNTGRYDGSDLLVEGIFGPTLVETTYNECVKLGMLCPIHVKIVRVPFKPFLCKDRKKAYKEIVYNNNKLAEIVNQLSNDVIPRDWQTLIFIAMEKQGEFLKKSMTEDIPIAMQKTFKSIRVRREFFRMLENDEIKRCLCSRIYSTGVTIPNIRVIINIEGGGGSISSVQKPGRLAEIKPNKKAGYLIDFLFYPDYESVPGWDLMDAIRRKEYKSSACNLVYYDSLNRIKSYKKTGYYMEFYESSDIKNIKFEDLENGYDRNRIVQELPEERVYQEEEVKKQSFFDTLID